MGAPPRSDQVPPLNEDMNDDQAPINPTPLTDGHIRFSFVHMS